MFLSVSRVRLGRANGSRVLFPLAPRPASKFGGKLCDTEGLIGWGFPLIALFDAANIRLSSPTTVSQWRDTYHRLPVF